jgi:signal transduction histidine kinase
LQKVTEELRDANEQLKELDRLKDEFVSTVSHELRTPLTSIRAFSEILLGEPEMQLEEREKYLQIVVTETERLTRLINDVLDLAKIESGNTEWQMQEQDLCEVIEEATNSVSQIYQNRIIDLSTKLPAEHIKVLLDRDHIMQVLLNLLSNAAKFCEPQTGRVGISVSLDSNQATVCVEDNGPGIDYSYQATIFDKFRQVQDQQKGKPKGSGLGLAICRPIIEHHNGRLWLESKPGQGSRFYFSLPLK